MKNIRNFLAISLLLSIPVAYYAMEDNAGFLGIDDIIDNAAEELLVEKIADKVQEKIENNVVKQGWLSNPLYWNYPSIPAIPNLGLQERWQAAAKSSYNPVNWNYPAMPNLGLQAKWQEAGKSAYNPVNWNYPSMPNLRLQERLQGARDLGWNYGGKQAYNAGAYGIERLGAGAGALKELAERNPEAAITAVGAASLGAWMLYRYNNPQIGDERTQAEINDLVKNFEATHAEEIRQATEVIVAAREEQLRKEEEVRQAAATERERIAKLSWAQYAAERANRYNPVQYLPSYNLWGAKEAVANQEAENVKIQKMRDRDDNNFGQVWQQV